MKWSAVEVDISQHPEKETWVKFWTLDGLVDFLESAILLDKRTKSKRQAREQAFNLIFTRPELVLKALQVRDRRIQGWRCVPEPTRTRRIHNWRCVDEATM
jgi:hypothetical protein